MRATLAKLDSDVSGGLSADDLAALRRQLGEQQTFMRETMDRLAQTQDENVLISRRRDELEQRIQTLEVEYEELLGMYIPGTVGLHSAYPSSTEKTIHEEETHDGGAESMQELKVRFFFSCWLLVAFDSCG